MLRKNNVFLTGKAGTGKSYITREIIKKVNGTIVLGSTGMAAINIGGMTVHSFFVLGPSNNADDLEAYENYRKNQLKSSNIPESSWDTIIFSKLTKALKFARLIVIDEISMISKDVLDMIFSRLRRFSPNRMPIPILVVGDFYQLPPVNAQYAFKSDNWNFVKVELDKIMRTHNMEFAEMQSRIRIGENTPEIADYIESLSKNEVDKPLKIFSKNVDVARENKAHIETLEGEEFKVETLFQVMDSRNQEQVIKSFVSELRVDPVFIFKIGARVMSVVNDGPLVNGLLGTIKDYKSNCITILTDDGREIAVCKYKFKKLTIDVDRGEIAMKEIASALQFPLVIAAAITIHKSQGSTINKLLIDCDNIFEVGQFYVAISRGVDPKNIQIKSFQRKHIRKNEDVDEFYKK